MTGINGIDQMLDVVEKLMTERDKYKAQRDALIECINITLIGLSKPDNGQIKIRVFDVLVAALNKIKEG